MVSVLKCGQFLGPEPRGFLEKFKFMDFGANCLIVNLASVIFLTYVMLGELPNLPVPQFLHF